MDVVTRSFDACTILGRISLQARTIATAIYIYLLLEWTRTGLIAEESKEEQIVISFLPRYYNSVQVHLPSYTGARRTLRHTVLY